MTTNEIPHNQIMFDYKTAAFELDQIRGWFQGLTPIRKIRADDWADKNIHLTTENSNKPGLWSTDTTPYMHEILECLSPTSPVQEVVWMKGVQVGATSVGLICMLCFVDTDPSPIMYVLPTVDIAKGFSKTRLQKIIDNSEALSAKIQSANVKGSGNTIQEKEYPGGYIVLAGANSAATLRSRPIRVLILDETDAYVKNLDKEGSPIALAEERTATYENNKKIFKLSTPTVAGASVIEYEFESTDQRYFHVPCPHCAVPQILEFTNIKWFPERKPTKAWYECEHCHEEIQERFKPAMFLSGEWIPTKPENLDPLRRGYHTGSLYSAYGFMSWLTIAKKYLKAKDQLDKGDDNLMRTFTNTIVGTTYSEGGEKPDYEVLYARQPKCEFNKPPQEAFMLTAGVDIQHDRIEVEIVAWARNFVSYSMDRKILAGNPTKPEVWAKLREVIDSKLVRVDGAIMPIKMTCIDTGHLATTVYEFVKGLMEDGYDNVVCIDGRPTGDYIFTTPTPAYRTKAGKGIGGVKIFPLGTFKLKKELYNFLNARIEELPDGTQVVPRGYCYFPAYEKVYFQGITAEEELTKWLKGYPKIEWKRNFKANEPLDLRCYARAALSIVGYERYSEEMILDLEESYMIREVIKLAPKRKSEFW